jgi:hypothetical protein
MGFYRGADAALLASVCNRVTMTIAWSIAKRFLLPRKASFLERTLIMDAMRILTVLIVYPIETVCHRMAMQSARNEKQYGSSLDCAIKIWKEEGWRGFYGNVSLSCSQSISMLFLCFLASISLFLSHFSQAESSYLFCQSPPPAL